MMGDMMGDMMNDMVDDMVDDMINEWMMILCICLSSIYPLFSL